MIILQKQIWILQIIFLEDWESKEEGNVKLTGLTEVEWMNLYLNFLDKK